MVTLENFRERLERGDGFLRNVIEGPKVFVVCNEETLRTLRSGFGNGTRN